MIKLAFILIWITQAEAYPKLDSNFHQNVRSRMPDAACPTRSNVISVADVQIAVLCSKFSYFDGEIKVGDIVPGTTFNVSFVYHGFLGASDKIGVRVFLAESGWTTAIVYRGTERENQSFMEIKDTIGATGIEDEILGTTTKISDYFLKGFELTFPHIRDLLTNQARRYVLTGHSLGGGLASVLALKMVEYDQGKMWENSRTCLITFGAPRVGDPGYARLHDEHIKSYKKLRFVFKEDPIPHVPDWPFFLHHSREVFINYEGELPKWYEYWKRPKFELFWRMCNKLEEFYCSNIYTHTLNITHHKIDVYQNLILKVPDLFKNRLGNVEVTFEDSIVNSCEMEDKQRNNIQEQDFQKVTMNKTKVSSVKKGRL